MKLKHKPRNTRYLRSQRTEADWVAWILHYLFGFIFGACLSLLLLPGPLYGAYALLCPIGGGMFIGGVASFFGDEYWLADSDSSQHFPTRAPERSSVTRILSIASGATGAACVINAQAITTASAH